MDALTRRLMAHPDNKTKQAMQHDCEQAAAELEALRKDAERYRKLRAGQYSYWTARSILNDSPQGIDAAVDALPAVGAA